jgi:hypothetical protein
MFKGKEIMTKEQELYLSQKKHHEYRILMAHMKYMPRNREFIKVREQAMEAYREYERHRNRFFNLEREQQLAQGEIHA